jgi:hypothetical protein
MSRVRTKFVQLVNLNMTDNLICKAAAELCQQPNVCFRLLSEINIGLGKYCREETTQKHWVSRFSWIRLWLHGWPFFFLLNYISVSQIGKSKEIKIYLKKKYLFSFGEETDCECVQQGI